jgi:hypothetical protein
MANNDNPTGLSPVMYQGGAAWTGAANWYYVPATDSTAVFIGDVVKLAGSADSRGIPSVARVATPGTDPIVGVVVGVSPTRPDSAGGRDSAIYREASTEAYLLVADDPNLLFSVQDDAGTAFTAATVGLNANLTTTAGSTVTGLSKIEINSATEAVTATLDVSIHRLVDREDNEIAANADWLVRINNHQFVDGTTGV